MGLIVKRIGLDFVNDTLSISDSVYHLDSVRRYLLVNHPLLCRNHFIKCIVSNGKRKFSFDWQGIFNISEEAGYLYDFHRSQTVIIRQTTIINPHIFHN